VAELALVKTGIGGLDDILGGGIPRGNLVVLEGAAGTGKTTLGLEFIYRGVRDFDEPGLVVLFEVSPEKIVRDAARLGWDLADLERRGQLKIVFTSRSVFHQELQQADSLLLQEAAQLGARRIFVDGVGLLPANGNGHAQRETFHVLAEALQREHLTAVLALETSAHEESRLRAVAPEEFVADTVIVLRAEPVQRAVLRSIEVMKSRGHEFELGRHSFRIVDGKGLEIYRRVQARHAPEGAEDSYDTSVRLTSGVPGLDELLGGGFWRGATVLAVGVSGTGKSVMALHYLAEGARRGERGLMVSVDESPAQIIRNARALGIDLQQEIDRGLVRIWYESPQEIEIDRHFAQVEEVVRTFKPQRVTIDSLSTYGATLGALDRSFRDFLHAFVSLMKQHHVTAVYNHENPQILGMGSMMGQFSLSSLVDTILLFNWVELGDTFRLGLTVAKMRGSPISRVTHECEVVDGVGMRVLPRAVAGVAPKLPFAAYYGLVSRAPERHLAPGDGATDAPTAAAPPTTRATGKRPTPSRGDA
jgi:circadian clock protein KaiC